MSVAIRKIEETVTKTVKVSVSDFSGRDLEGRHWSALTSLKLCVFDGAGNEMCKLNLDGTPEQIEEFIAAVKHEYRRMRKKYGADK